MSFERALAITTAPTQHQVRDLLWKEIRRIWFANKELIGGRIGRTSLELGPNRYAVGLSTDSPERFQGFHDENILFVVDEASGVNEEIFDAIEGSMTSHRARLLLIGNPSSLAGTFYEAFHGRRELYRTVHISAFDLPDLARGEEGPVQAQGSPRSQRHQALPTPLVPPSKGGTAESPLPRGEGEGEGARSNARTAGSVKKPAIPGLTTRRWVEEAKQTWGESDPQYQVRVLGQFPKNADDTLVSLALIEAAVHSMPGPVRVHGAETVIGVDVARFGTDRTVLCVRNKDTVVALRQYEKLDTMKTVGLVRRAIEEFNPAAVHIDEIGIGAGVVDRLHELGFKRKVKGVNVGSKAKDRDHYANLRAELYDAVRKRFEEERISIPGNPDLISQLAAIRVEFTSRGQLRIEAKETMRRRYRSPDMADALVLAFMPAKSRRAPWWRGGMLDEDMLLEHMRKKKEAEARGEVYVAEWERE